MLRQLRPIAAVLAITLFAGSAIGLEDPDKDSWKKKGVYWKKPLKEITFTAKDSGKKVEILYQDIFPLEVLDERDGEILIFAENVKGWVAKDDFIIASKAARHFTERIDNNADDSFAFLMRGIANWSVGETEKAMDDLAESERLNPKMTATFSARGRIYMVTALRKIMAYNAWKNDPKNDAKHLLDEAKEEFEKALGQYDGVTKIDPKDANAFLYRGMIWVMQNDNDKAIKEFDGAIRLNPKQSNYFYIRGGVLMDKSQYKKAIADFDESIRLAPEFASAFRLRGNCHAIEGENDLAIKDYDQAIRLNPNDIDALFQRAREWQTKKEYDKAIKDADEVIRLNPKYTSAYSLRGSLFSIKKDYDRAIKDFDQVVSMNPQSPFSFQSRAHAWFQKGEYEKAINDYDKAIALYPKQYPKSMLAKVIRDRGYYKMAKGDYKKVIEDCEEAIRNDPSDAYSYILGYMAARYDKNDIVAKRFLADAKTNAKKDSWPYPIVEFLSSGINEESLKKHFTNDNNRTEGHCYLGLYHALAGRKDEAVTHFRWVKENGLSTYYEYALCLEGLKSLSAEKAK